MTRKELEIDYNVAIQGKNIRDLSIDKNQEMIEDYEKRKLKIMF